jgi:hypothetical protein
MRLKLERVNARGTRTRSKEYGVFDEATCKCVGTVSIDPVPRLGHKSYPIRTIRLFDSTYIGSFNTHAECVAFVKGVETVLNYMLKAKDMKSIEVALNQMLEAKEFETPPERAEQLPVVDRSPLARCALVPGN